MTGLLVLVDLLLLFTVGTAASFAVSRLGRIAATLERIERLGGAVPR